MSRLTDARGELERYEQTKPADYQSKYQGQINDVMSKLNDLGEYDYDPAADTAYQQYKSQYAQKAKLANQNAQANASAMTGGYGSSYSQQAGQQAYNAYLQKLNEVVPELYAQARSQYDCEGLALSERYALISSREKSDYDRYRDQVSDYYAALSDARGAYQSEAQRSENLALQYAKLANDNYWNELNYRSDREDAANAQYWKQLAYADKQAAAAEKAAQARQKAAQAGTAKDKQTKRSSSLARGRGEKRGRTAPGTARRDEIN